MGTSSAHTMHIVRTMHSHAAPTCNAAHHTPSLSRLTSLFPLHGTHPMLHPMTIQASCRSPAVYGTSSPCLLLATASWPTPGHLGNATAPMKLQLSKRDPKSGWLASRLLQLKHV